jgi:hypothetical protein
MPIHTGVKGDSGHLVVDVEYFPSLSGNVARDILSSTITKPGRLARPRMLTDRRAVSSFEYALLAGALAFVFFEVLQMPAEALGNVITGLLAGVGGHGPGG